MVDPENFDFRPKLNNEITVAEDDDFIGPYSALIGFQNTSNHMGHYWIPGSKLGKASFPIPPNKAVIKEMRDVVMCQTGYR